VVRNLSFDIRSGEKFAIVGESGCGKSVTSLAIMGLLPPALAVKSGEIALEGRNLIKLNGPSLHGIRGKRIAMVFQEPMTSLNPSMTIGAQIAEMIQAHEPVGRKDARTRAIGLLRNVHLPDPERIVDEYPHRLSGGQRQRVVIAIAIACKPDLVIADEPTTALDVMTQAHIMSLLTSLQRDLGMAILLITHNLGLVAQFADRVMVMYAGGKIEEAATDALFAEPRHPYTRGLMAATPQPGKRRENGKLLQEIPGLVPSIHDLPFGCSFAPRCDLVIDACRMSEPPMVKASTGGMVACVRAAKEVAS
jgi:peptide/nickel transport system ATP-binding protein